MYILMFKKLSCVNLYVRQKFVLIFMYVVKKKQRNKTTKI